MDELFWDEASRAYFDTAKDGEPLITRPREVTDNAVPAGTSLAAELLLRLAELDADSARRTRANWVLETLAEPMARFGTAFGHLLGVADVAVHGAVELAIVGDPAAGDTKAMLGETARTYLPAVVIAAGETSDPRLLEGRTKLDGRATAYVCRNYVCERPVTSARELRQMLESSTSIRDSASERRRT